METSVVGRDPDWPAQSLTYERVEMPEGALIEAANGLVRWTPTATQAATTHRFLVRVTDDGVPPLSATNQFLVMVRKMPDPPATIDTLTCELRPNGFLILFKAAPGQRYLAQWSLDLDTWHALRELTPDSTQAELLDETLPLKAQRFYRIQLLRP